MKIEKQRLIHDLLDDENRREATLLAAATALRRRRQWRVSRRSIALLLLAAATVVLLEQKRPGRTLAQVSPSKDKPSAPLQAQSLTDEQLLSLFPNTPIGLATLPN